MDMVWQMYEFFFIYLSNYYIFTMTKLSADGRKGGLLVGKTDKDGGIGIPATVGGSRQVILGGGEIIINEEAANQNCEELSRINESTGGRHIDCAAQPTANTGKFNQGGGVSNPYEDFLLKNGFEIVFERKSDKFKQYRKGRWYCWIDTKKKEIEIGKFESDVPYKELDGIRENIPYYHSDKYTNSFSKFKKFLDDNYVLEDSFSYGGKLESLNSFQQLAFRYNGK